MLIGLTQQIGKLLFESAHPRLPVIANQCAHWCGNPPVERNRVTITTKNHGELHRFWCFSVHFSTNRGIATTSVRTGLAMTALFFKHQFVWQHNSWGNRGFPPGGMQAKERNRHESVLCPETPSTAASKKFAKIVAIYNYFVVCYIR